MAKFCWKLTELRNILVPDAVFWVPKIGKNVKKEKNHAENTQRGIFRITIYVLLIR